MHELPSNKDEISSSTSEVIIRDFEIEGIDNTEQVDEQKLFDLLADQIAYMIEFRLEHLFSLLYRMDVKENLVRAALAPEAPDPPNIGIAKLVLNRQKQRNISRANIKSKDFSDEDWDW